MRRRRKRKPHDKILYNFDWLTLDRAVMGSFFVAGKGTGKTRSTIRDFVWRLFWMGIGIIVHDVVGAAVLNFVDKVLRLPKAWQPQAFKRIRVFRFSGDHLPGFPLYYRLGSESLYQISMRPLLTFLKLDPSLQTASIEGWNSIQEVGSNAGMILAALGLQITEMEDLLLHPKTWKRLLQLAVHRNPEAAPAVEYFYTYMTWDPRTRSRKIGALLGKLQIFKQDPNMRAIFGASHLSLNLEEIKAKGLIIFLDTSSLTGEAKQFVDAYLFQFILENVKHQGVGHQIPWLFYEDELSAVVNKNTTGKVDYVAADIQQLSDVWARNANMMYFMSSQHLHSQFSDDMVSTLLSSGNLILGNMSDEEDRRTLANQLIPYHADRVNHLEPVYSGTPPQVIDWRPRFFSVSEKQAIATQAFVLGKFRYVVRHPRSQGDLTGTVKALNEEGLDRGDWVNEGLVKPVIDLVVTVSEPPRQEREQEINQRKEKLLESESPQKVVTPSQQATTTEPKIQETDKVPVAAIPETDILLIDLLKKWQQQPLKKKWDIPFKDIT